MARMWDISCWWIESETFSKLTRWRLRLSLSLKAITHAIYHSHCVTISWLFYQWKNIKAFFKGDLTGTGVLTTFFCWKHLGEGVLLQGVFSIAPSHSLGQNLKVAPVIQWTKTPPRECKELPGQLKIWRCYPLKWQHLAYTQLVVFHHHRCEEKTSRPVLLLRHATSNGRWAVPVLVGDNNRA